MHRVAFPPEPLVQGQRRVTAQAGGVAFVPGRHAADAATPPSASAPPPDDIPTLRRWLRACRRSVTPAFARHAAARTARLAAALPEIRSARTVALYWPASGELSSLPLIERLLRLGKTVALPVVPPSRPGAMRFAAIRPGERMTRNRFGIPEPCPFTRARLRPRNLDVVFVPLVGIDPEGNRLGTGGGYYDRTFGFRRRLATWRRPRLIGLAYRFQSVPALPRRAWDVPLDGLCNEAGCVRFRR